MLTYLEVNTKRYIGLKRGVSPGLITSSPRHPRFPKISFRLQSLNELRELSMNQFFNGHEKAFTPTQVAYICGVSVSTVYAWISRREIASVKCGTSRFITYRQIQEMYGNRRTSDFVDRTYADRPKR